MATQSQVRIGWRPYVNLTTATYLLDTYAGSSVAYSMRKLNSTYTGSAIRVRRSGDNAEQNIGFDASGNLDTTSLLSFIGANNIALMKAAIKKWKCHIRMGQIKNIFKQ